MRRRSFLAGIAALTAMPPAVLAQENAVRRVGLLFSSGVGPTAGLLADAVRQGLAQEGWSDGVNLFLSIEAGLSDLGRLAMLAADLVAAPCDVLIGGATPAALALARATSAIPVVFASVSDPVGSGLIRSYAQPDGNVTGFANLEPSLGSKWLDLLRQVKPGIARAGLMFNPTATSGPLFWPSFEAAALLYGIEPFTVEAATLDQIDLSIASLAGEPGVALCVASDSYLYANRPHVIAAVARHGITAIYPFPEFATEGGLLAFGADNLAIYRGAGTYAGRILSGAAVGQLPVQAPTEFDLVINLRTAAAQGIAVPPTLLALADVVIE